MLYTQMIIYNFVSMLINPLYIVQFLLSNNMLTASTVIN